MATLIIENVPDSFIKKYYKTTFSYDEIIIKPKKIKEEEDITIKLQKSLDDPENTLYGPFTPEEFLAELKKW